MADKLQCTERVWDIGDMTDCGAPAILTDVDGVHLCIRHVKSRLRERHNILTKIKKIGDIVHDSRK